VSSINDLKSLLAETHHQEYVCFAGNGTLAISELLRVLDFQKRFVAVPLSVCLNVPLAVLLSGNIPLYIDVEPESMGMDPALLEELPEPPAAVIAVHAYGNLCRMKDISNYCSARGVFLIEDFCVAQGAGSPEGRAGSWGDASVVSFGAGKIVSIGNGGAVLSSDRKLIEALELRLSSLPAFSEANERGLSELSRWHTRIYNEHYRNALEKIVPEMLDRIRQSNAFFQYSFLSDWVEPLTRRLRELPALVAHRRRCWSRFEDILGKEEPGLGFRIHRPPPGFVPWRFNIFLDQGRDDLLRWLLMQKEKVSSWFPAVDRFLNVVVAEKPPRISDRIGDSILNLWVNEEIDEEYLVRMGDAILSFCRRSER